MSNVKLLYLLKNIDLSYNIVNKGINVLKVIRAIVKWSFADKNGDHKWTISHPSRDLKPTSF